MLKFRTAPLSEGHTTLPAYFQETVFLTASDSKGDRSFFMKVFKTDFKKAEGVAKLFMTNGAKMAARMADPNFTCEDGIVALIDMQRKKMGVPVNKMVHYKNGDANRLWPGLHMAPR